MALASADCIGMQVMANEEVDPAVLIRLLKQEVADLREELRWGHC